MADEQQSKPSELRPPGEYVDERGRLFSPLIERGSDQVPRSVPMPSPAEMRGMSKSELSAIMTRFGWVPTWANEKEVHAKWLERWGITTDDPRYEREMERLLQSETATSMLGETRRLAESYETLAAIDGNVNTETIYINEGEDPCEECVPLAGEIMTYAERVATKSLPGDRCLGGSNCLCAIMAF